MVFSGNPGTGKTTVARVIAGVYGSLGLLKTGKLTEVDRSGLVGNYVGQTANKTKQVIEEAKGGILFIDEAYALAKDSGVDYGHEAIEILLKEMEDHRDEIVVVVAGYEREMAKFLASNPGVRSRFPREIHFPDYSPSEMLEIFERNAHHNNYIVSDSARQALVSEMQRRWEQRAPDFANARDVRNLFERVIAMQANRIGRMATIDDEALLTLTDSDVAGAVNPTVRH